MSDMRRVRSYSEANKTFSPRTYSFKEVAAGRRLGLINGSAIRGTIGGPLFWATGPWAANEVERLRRKATQTLADTEIVAAAIDREWDRPWDWDDGEVTS